MRFPVALVAAFMFAYPSIVKCEPSAEVKYLMSEPASMWDLAFLRMEVEYEGKVRSIAQAVPGLEILAVIPSYSREKNEIIIIIMPKYEGYTTAEAVKGLIRRFHKEYYAAYPEFEGLDGSRMLFGHRYFSSSAENSIDLGRVAALVRFKFNFRFLGGSKSQPQFGKVDAEWDLDGSNFMLSE